jgi:hypothetical protein
MGDLALPIAIVLAFLFVGYVIAYKLLPADTEENLMWSPLFNFLGPLIACFLMLIAFGIATVVRDWPV